MKQIEVNPSNEKYYSSEFIKGFNCGAQRQFEADMADCKTESQRAVGNKAELTIKEGVVKVTPMFEDEPQTCDTCKWGEWYRQGYDITMMSDECGGCCSWNNKWKPKTEPQTEGSSK